MTEHRYSTAALNGDLVRAGIGFALCAAPIAFAAIPAWVTLLFATPAGLFVVFQTFGKAHRVVCDGIALLIAIRLVVGMFTVGRHLGGIAANLQSSSSPVFDHARILLVPYV